PGGLPRWLVELLGREARIPAERIAVSATLPELGADSLATVQLAAAIEERIEIEVPVEILVGRTLAALADWVDHTSLPTQFVARPDLEAAAALDPDIAPAAPVAGGDSVLLTGATGTLGAYLLCELLARSTRRVICLVRATDAEHARDRLG